MTKNKRGFTLIELLVVVAIIAILSVTVVVALNPVQRFGDARNSRRYADVNSVLTAVHEYVVDNDGALPTGLNTTLKQLGTCASGGATLCPGAAAACLDLSTLLSKYLKSIPFDSKTGSASTSAYTVQSDANGIVTVSACSAENSTPISVSR